DGSAPNGFSISKWTISRPSQSITSALNGNLRSKAARNVALDPGLRTTKVPAAAILAQPPCEDTRAKGPMSANVDASQENDESQTVPVCYCDDPSARISYSLCTKPPL